MLYIGFALTILLAGLNFLGQFLYLYWIYWWFDVLMHLLAGLAGGATAYGVLSRLGRVSVGRVVWCFVTVAIAWEIFEYVYDIAVTQGSYTLDTISDILLGILGALISSIVGAKREKRELI